MRKDSLNVGAALQDILMSKDLTFGSGLSGSIYLYLGSNHG